MKSKRMLRIGARPALASALAVALSLGFAGTATAQQSMRSDSSHLVMSGGVGEEARARLARHEHEANLKLVFSEPEGSYLADIGVKVFDRSGAMVLDTRSDGPWLLARLSPGTYRVVAMDGGVQREHRVSVGQGLRVVHIRMPNQGGITGRPSTG